MRLVIAAMALAASVAAAFGQTIPAAQTDSSTVLGLVTAGFEIKGVIPTSAGPGILLQGVRNNSSLPVLMMCFVAETPDSATIATQYCKPVE